MSTYEVVLEAKNQKDALLAIAAGIDDLIGGLTDLIEFTAESKSKYGGWDEDGFYNVVEIDPQVTVADDVAAPRLVESIPNSEGGIDTVYEVEVVGEELQAKRRALVPKLGLEHFPELKRMSDEERIETYVKGGPEWLYIGWRDQVVQLPGSVRQQIVQDYFDRGLQKEGWDVARDLLKQDSDETVYIEGM